MIARHWPPALAVAAGLTAGLAEWTWNRHHWKPHVAAWESVPLLVTLPLAMLLVWRVVAAALAAWADLAPDRARRRAALAQLPLVLLLGSAAQIRWGTPSTATGLAAVAGLLAAAAHAGLFWQNAPATRLRGGLAEAAVAALRAAAAAARQPLGIGLVVLLLLDVRLLWLAADPPVELGPSGGAWTDPAEYAHNARNRVLYGAWVWDEVNFMYVSPVTNLCFYLVFRLLGVGYAQVGLVSVLFGLAALPLFYGSLRAAMGRGGALLATGLLGGSYLFITYNRIGLVETPAVFFQTLTLYWAQRGLRNPRVFALAGAASVTTLAVKMQTAHIIPAAFLAILLWGLRWPERPEPGPRTLAPAAWFLGGAALMLGILVAFWIVPHWAEITWRLQNEWRLHALPMTVPRLVRNVLRNPVVGYSLGSPLLLLAAGAVVCHVLVRLLGNRGAVPFPQLFAFWWFAGGFAYLAIAQYRPLRYYVSLIPPMVILATSAVLGLWRARPTPVRPPTPLAVWVYAAGGFVVALALVQVAYARSAAVQALLGFLSLYPLTDRELALATAVVVLALAAATFRVLGPRLARSLAALPAWLPRAVAVAAVVVHLLGEGWSYLDWAVHREYKLVSVSRHLGRRLPEGSVLAGIYAPALTLENRHRALAIWERYGNWEGDPLARFGVTHVAVMAYIDEIGYYQRRFPDAMGRARLLDEWIFWKTRVSLYELPRRDTVPR